MGYSRPLFLYFHLFNTVDSNIKFANDWIQAVGLWCSQQLLYQLSHNHCPNLTEKRDITGPLYNAHQYSRLVRH